MASYVIAGAGAAGLYTAYRLLKSGKLVAGEDTIDLLEWSPVRVGGRIHTYTFPDQSGQYVETGGMRFSKDVNFPTSIVTGHVFVQNLIVQMGLSDKVVDFFMSNLGPGTGSGRLYYLRGQNFYETHVVPGGVKLPYNFDAPFIASGYNNMVAEAVFGELANIFAPGSQYGWNRAQWCTYFAKGAVPEGAGTRAFEAGTAIGDIGYWNLLYDQLGDEGFDYVTDANGFASNTINWHSADAMQSNTEFGDGSSYSRIQGGYSSLFEALRQKIAFLGRAVQDRDPLSLDTRVTSFTHDEAAGTFELRTVTSKGEAGVRTCDHLFLAMPRQSLELLAAGCGADNPLNDPKVRLYIESAMNQPAYKVAMLFDEAWWLDDTIVKFKPNLSPAGSGGPTMTDLPLRQIYYFGNDATDTTQGGPYVLLATYDDMQFVTFWQEMETAGSDQVAGSLDYQPLIGPTEVPTSGPMAQILLSQLASVHGADPEALPQPISVVFQDWGRNPFGAGYHGWAPHYDICTVMQDIRTPGTLAGKPMNLYIIGSCYSIDQAWVEGALCTAESVLTDFFGLQPFCPLPESYNLICTPADAKRPLPRGGSSGGKATPSGT